MPKAISLSERDSWFDSLIENRAVSYPIVFWHFLWLQIVLITIDNTQARLWYILNFLLFDDRIQYLLESNVLHETIYSLVNSHTDKQF